MPPYVLTESDQAHLVAASLKALNRVLAEPMEQGGLPGVPMP